MRIRMLVTRNLMCLIVRFLSLNVFSISPSLVISVQLITGRVLITFFEIATNRKVNLKITCNNHGPKNGAA